MQIESRYLLPLLEEFNSLTPVERKIFLSLLSSKTIPKCSTRVIDSFVAKINKSSILIKAVGFQCRKSFILKHLDALELVVSCTDLNCSCHKNVTKSL